MWKEAEITTNNEQPTTHTCSTVEPWGSTASRTWSNGTNDEVLSTMPKALHAKTTTERLRESRKITQFDRISGETAKQIVIRFNDIVKETRTSEEDDYFRRSYTLLSALKLSSVQQQRVFPIPNTRKEYDDMIINLLENEYLAEFIPGLPMESRQVIDPLSQK